MTAKIVPAELQLDLFHELIVGPPCGRRGCPRQYVIELASAPITSSPTQKRCEVCGGVAPHTARNSRT